jgi:hypothetical protein
VSSQQTPAQIAAQLFSPPVALVPPITLCSVSRSNDLLDKLKDFLNGRLGEIVTMKRVQSRFDAERGRTCADYASLVSRLGVRVNKPTTHPSKWYVNLPSAI